VKVVDITRDPRDGRLKFLEPGLSQHTCNARQRYQPYKEATGNSDCRDYEPIDTPNFDFLGLPPLVKGFEWFVLRHISQYNLQEKSFPFPAPLYDHKL
jgi:hypothetical protein